MFLGIKKYRYPYKKFENGIDFVPQSAKRKEIKMDNKNVLVALALSMSVLLFWAAFFETLELQTIKLSRKKQILKIYLPHLKREYSNKKSQEQSINNSKRVTIENNNIVGSLLLKAV